MGAIIFGGSFMVRGQFSGEQLSSRVIARGAILLGVNYPRGQFPGGNYPGSNFPRGQLS